MELKLGVLCDAANISQNGKLNILGEFNMIFSAEDPPIRWPLFNLVARIEAPTVEGTQHLMEIDLVDSDGQSIIVGDRPRGDLSMSPSGPGRPLRAQLVIGIQDLTFPDYGDYEFHIIVDTRSVGTVPVYVVHVENQPAAPAS